MDVVSVPGLAGAALVEYERHEPEETLLHRVVREELEPFLRRSRSAGAPAARFVEREVRAHLECGVLAHGLLRVHCDDCGEDRLVAFSCKGAASVRRAAAEEWRIPPPISSTGSRPDSFLCELSLTHRYSA